MCVYGEAYVHDLRSRLQTIKNWRWGTRLDLHTWACMWVCVFNCMYMYVVCMFVNDEKATNHISLLKSKKTLHRATHCIGCVCEPLTPSYYQQGTNFSFPLSLFFVFRYISSTSILARASLSFTRSMELVLHQWTIPLVVTPSLLQLLFPTQPEVMGERYSEVLFKALTLLVDILYTFICVYASLP